MKVQIRRGVFETNSSSEHAIAMCGDDEWQKWKNGEYTCYCVGEGDTPILMPISDKEALIKGSKELEEKYEICCIRENDFHTFKHFFAYDTFGEMKAIEAEYTTPNGEVVHGFAYSTN
jgi:hypothetical protein